MSTTGSLVAIGRLLAKLPELEQRKIDKALEEQYRDTINEVRLALAAFVERYDREGVTAEQLAEKIDERAATVLFLQLFDQAVKSVTCDRLQLMAAAVAGIFTPDLDVEMKSRAARALSQLEARDAVHLRRLVIGELPLDALFPLPSSSILGEQDPPLEGGEPSATALLQAGCVSIRSSGALGSSEFYLTSVAAAVVALVEGWVPEPTRTEF